MNNNKRKRSEDDDDDITKRHKVTGTVSSLHSKRETSPQFQRFHLSILQSLYESDEEEDAEDVHNAGSKASTAVDEELWKQTKKFLREREKLIRQKKEASRLKDVHQEALNFMDERERDSLALSPSPRTTCRSVSEAKTGSSMIPLVAQSSGYKAACASPAHSLSFFSPQPAPSQQASVANSESKSPVKCFGLVATLLEKKFQAFENSARYCSDPYGPVLKEIDTNISKLENQLQRLQENALANQKQAVEDLLSRPVLLSSLASSKSIHHQNGDAIWTASCGTGGLKDAKSALSKLETKLSLWKMLATDMKVIVVVN